MTPFILVARRTDGRTECLVFHPARATATPAELANRDGAGRCDPAGVPITLTVPCHLCPSWGMREAVPAEHVAPYRETYAVQEACV